MAFMLQGQSRFLWMRNALCVPLAAMLLVLSSRTAVECISTFALLPSQVSGQASGWPSAAGAVDRKPKPTRQQERTSIACLLELRWLSLSKPVPPGEPTWRSDLSLSAQHSLEWSPAFESVEATKPAYLRPSEHVPQCQLPPPARTSAFA